MPHQTKKNRRNRFAPAKISFARKRKTTTEDFVGNFLFSVAVAGMTTLITLACAGQAHWE
ncbi:MAG: hypothetical protein BroJett039_13780 [Chloroflexota bacterium]|nr:MAG: hypothetical protein BroJett039_13780 [Chloroflexota bacterium]